MVHIIVLVTHVFSYIQGGMKAVLLTDTLQLVIMFIGIIGVFIYGVVHAGGFGEVMRIAKQSGRLDMLE